MKSQMITSITVLLKKLSMVKIIQLKQKRINSSEKSD